MLADVNAEKLELYMKMTKLYNNPSFQAFFEAYISSRAFIEWLREITHSKYSLRTRFVCLFI